MCGDTMEMSTFCRNDLLSDIFKGGRRLLASRVSGQGGVNPNVLLEDSILDSSTIFEDCVNFSDPNLNLQLLTIYQKLAIEHNSNISFIRSSSVKTFEFIKTATREQLGAMASLFFCLFEPADIEAVNACLEKKIPPDSMSNPLRNEFCRIYWSTLWQTCHNFPFRAVLMFNIPADIAFQIGSLSASSFFEFLKSVSRLDFKLRHHNSHVLEMLSLNANKKFKNKYFHICSLISIQQLLINKSLLSSAFGPTFPSIDYDELNAVSKKPEFDVEQYAKEHGLNKGQLIRLIKTLRFNERLKLQTKDITMLYCKYIALFAAKWGLPNRKVAFLSQLQEHQIPTIRKNSLILALQAQSSYKKDNSEKNKPADKIAKNITQASPESNTVPKHKTDNAYLLIAKSLFSSIYYLLGGQKILMTIDLDICVLTHMITCDILNKVLKDTQIKINFTPVIAFELAKNIRETHVIFNFCEKCGCMYVTYIDDDGAQERGCPYCSLLARSNQQIRKFLEPKRIPI